MPLIGLIDGELVDALDENVTTARCRDGRCDAPMYRRAGKGMVPHWAHNPGTAERCEADHKVTLWHGTWQLKCLDRARIEVTHGNRRADVLTRFGWAIEFQHSNLKTADVHAREDDWHGQLIWVHDGTGNTRDNLTVEPDGTFRWISPPSRIGAGRCHQLVDLGDGQMLWLPGVKLPTGGRDLEGYVGKLVTAPGFIDVWMNGDQPKFPAGWETSRWQVERKNPPKKRAASEARPERIVDALFAAQAEAAEQYQCARAKEAVEQPCIDCSDTPRRGPLSPIPPGFSLCSEHWPIGGAA